MNENSTGDPNPSNPNARKPLHQYRLTKQTLPGWRPVLTSKGAIILLCISTILLILVGLALFFNQNAYNEVKVRYDDKCPPNGKSCIIKLKVKNDIKGNLEMRYILTKFYQNHRRYGYSRNDAQLAGEYVDFDGMSNCKPYRSIDDSPDKDKWIIPCGLFPYSVFNDTFTILNSNLNFTEKGIAFKSEIDSLFKPLNKEYSQGEKNATTWIDEKIFEGGQTNERFIVWMRQAALPTISKTYARCDDCTLQKGVYDLQITSNYPTDGFGGYKYIAISKVTTIGTGNIALGIMFVIGGGMTLIFGLVLFIAEIVDPREMGEFND
ncbi:Cell cycle control protein 50A [Tritrichomonas foetus]|uniref:Cell cycle control protein 50A n=1 Tax=Tritrichomonas foetus TaxID=1144522 RepID=A0A1J4J1Z9_9EUKA|nr:Cell cycle control protein 50A [Tritrichomonas foetus]|eukprot:OHS93520.1 Cell cycle control protein 50A [Tritrichomonas foetus]